jgi:hypothetical protein
MTALRQHGTVASSRRSSDQQFRFASAPQHSEIPSARRELRARPIPNVLGNPGLLSYPEFSFELSIAHTIHLDSNPVGCPIILKYALKTLEQTNHGE